jgi:hypothetical protein
MIRKTLIAVAAAATMALGMGAATAPAEAGVKVYIGTPYIGYHNYKYKKRYHRAPYHCHKRVVWKYGYKKVVKTCHRGWH